MMMTANKAAINVHKKSLILIVDFEWIFNKMFVSDSSWNELLLLGFMAWTQV